MVAFSRGESGTLSYQRYISADESTLHVQERYASSEAMLEHNQAFAALFSPRFATMAWTSPGRQSHSDVTLCISLVITHKKYTGRLQNDFNAHA